MSLRQYFWYRFLILWTLGLLATLAVLPYALTLQAGGIPGIPIPLGILVLLTLIQSGVLLALAIGFGLKMADKLGFQTPLLKAVLLKEHDIFNKSVLTKSVLLGLGTGCAIFVGDILFALIIPQLTAVTLPVLWKGLLASLYGGITEEIIMRLFLMTFILWAISRTFSVKDIRENKYVVFSVIAIVAIVFGLLHLPATAAIIDITPLVIVRALVLNGIGALVFGWMYWRHGLEYAMVAHLTTDVVLQSLTAIN